MLTDAEREHATLLHKRWCRAVENYCNYRHKMTLPQRVRANGIMQAARALFWPWKDRWLQEPRRKRVTSGNRVGGGGAGRVVHTRNRR